MFNEHKYNCFIKHILTKSNICAIMSLWVLLGIIATKRWGSISLACYDRGRGINCVPLVLSLANPLSKTFFHFHKKSKSLISLVPFNPLVLFLQIQRLYNQSLVFVFCLFQSLAFFLQQIALCPLVLHEHQFGLRPFRQIVCCTYQ